MSRFVSVFRYIKSDIKKGANLFRISKKEFFRQLLLSPKRIYRHFFDRELVGQKNAKDILFITEYHINYIERYRVDHPIEQLTANGMSCDKVPYDDLKSSMVKYYRGFVFYRCPITPVIMEFIKIAKSMNKTCFFSVDDLVIDTKYTSKIKAVQQLGASERKNYDDGVERMKATMEMCDYGIVTTERLQQELLNYKNLKEVFINRNVMSDEMVSCSEEVRRREANDSRIIIGYFSGSVTHNEDFEMVLPSIIGVLKKYDNVYLKIAGTLDVPAELQQFGERVISVGFKEDWRKLPAEIAECDINIAPLKQSIFNEAKSEIKWLEAALVKVPTIASDIGAFKHEIINGKTGILTKNDTKSWQDALELLITNATKRVQIGNEAYSETMKNHVAIYNGHELARFVMSKLSPNVAFVVPSTNVSGGMIVVFKHAEILRKNGYDVSVINVDVTRHYKLNNLDRGNEYGVFISQYNKIDMSFDHMVATMWLTLEYANKYAKKRRVSYLVQNFETDFYEYGRFARIRANETYDNFSPVNYITVSKWCQKWLKDRFDRSSQYASNGIDFNTYGQRVRKLNNKVKILIEGDSRVDYKKVDESFKVANKLDPNKYEIAYLSYNGKPKSWYRVDHFYNRLTPDESKEIYLNADILIKSSLLESFSYPPLDMIATGGFVVLAPNDGNAEYIIDGKNALYYESGNINDAVEKINLIVGDTKLQKKLSKNGVETAKNYDWSKKEKEIMRLYE